MNERPLRLLVIEDDSIDREALRRVAGALSFPVEVDEHPDAESAFHAMHGDLPDVVLLDHHLPDAKAPDVLARLRTIEDAPPVVLLTGSTDAQSIARSMQAGAVEYLPKSALSGSSLERAIGTALRAAASRRAVQEAVAELERRERALSRIVAAGLELHAAVSPREALDVLGRATEETFLSAVHIVAVVGGESISRGGELTNPQTARDLRGQEPWSGSVELLRALSQAEAVLLDDLLRAGALAIDAMLARSRAETAAREREELLAIVSHDLRSPLQAVSLAAQLLNRVTSEEERADIAARIQRGARQMDRLLSDLIDVAKVQEHRFPLELAVEDLSLVLQQLVAELAPVASEAGLSLQLEAPPSLSLQIDAQRIRQAVGNLIANGIRHAPTGTALTVALAREGARARIQVRDQGAGVPAALRGRLFERLVQGEGRRGSLGLGLFIARGIAEAHGGTIGVEPTGSVFWIELPISDDS